MCLVDLPTAKIHKKQNPTSLYFYFSNHLRRNAAHDGVGRNVLGHHGTSGYYGAVADGDACQNRGIRAYPDVLADVNRGIAHALPFGGGEVVVERSKFL